MCLAEARILTQPGLSGRLINQTSFQNAFSSSLQIDLTILLQPPSVPTQNWQSLLHLFLMSVASVVFKIVLHRAYLPAHPGELDCNFLASYKALLLPGQPYLIEELSQLHDRPGRERKRELVGREDNNYSSMYLSTIFTNNVWKLVGLPRTVFLAYSAGQSW